MHTGATAPSALMGALRFQQVPVEARGLRAICWGISLLLL